jgi:hypothetical protein
MSVLYMGLIPPLPLFLLSLKKKKEKVLIVHEIRFPPFNRMFAFYGFNLEDAAPRQPRQRISL